MLYRQDNQYSIPEAAEIATWARERCLAERTKVRTEIAFIHGDRAYGGPSRDEQRAALRNALTAIEARLAGTAIEARLAGTAIEARLAGTANGNGNGNGHP